MSAAPPPAGRPAVAAAGQHPLLSAWPGSAQTVLAFLCGIAVTLIALQAFGTFRGPRPTELDFEPQPVSQHPAVRRKPAPPPTQPGTRDSTHPVADTAPVEAVSAKSARLQNKLIDPNSATAEELQSIPGVGPKTAERIIDERKKKPFEKVEDLRRVYGIGAKTLEKLKPYITVSPPPVRVPDAE